MLPRTLDNPYNIKKWDGIVGWNKDSLAKDPSIIVPTPRGPGESFFHVDNVLQIRAGDYIFYSSEAENDPIAARQAYAELLKARRERDKLPPELNAYKHWDAEVERLQRISMAFHENRRQVRSVRIVIMADPRRNLIAVNQPFTYGHKPRILGICCRIIGFLEEQIDEPTTDKLHKEAKKLYGSYDWESEFTATGAFPAL